MKTRIFLLNSTTPMNNQLTLMKSHQNTTNFMGKTMVKSRRIQSITKRDMSSKKS